MADTGFCVACGMVVPIDQSGCCPAGHSVSPAPAGESPNDAPSAAESVTPAKRGRWALWIGVGAGVLLLLVGACVAIIVAVRPLLQQGSSLAGEWKARLAKDYPGWSVVGFNVRSYSGGDTEYAFALVPPGRNFPVGVVYVSTAGTSPVSKDDVLRPTAQYSSRAQSLLDYLAAHYIDARKAVAAVTTKPNGSVTVTWRQTTHVGPISASNGSFDTLTFDSSTNSWSATPGP